MQESIAATPLHIFSACSHQVILGALGGKHAVTTPLHIFSACSHQVILGALGGKHAVTMFMNALPMLLCSLDQGYIPTFSPKTDPMAEVQQARFFREKGEVAML